MNNIQQYLERALELIKEALEKHNAGQFEKANTRFVQLQGYLEGGIEITKLLEENDKTKKL